MRFATRQRLVATPFFRGDNQEEDLNDTHDAEPIVGFAERNLILVYEGAEANLPTWYALSVSIEGGGFEFHAIAEGFDLNALTDFRELSAEGSVDSSHAPPAQPPPGPPDRIATMSRYEGEEGTRLPGRPLDEALGCIPPCAFSFTLQEVLHPDRIRLDEQTGIRWGLEVPIAYEDVAPDEMLTEFDRIESVMCLDGRWVAFEYIDSIIHPSGAFLLNLFGFRYGWNAILMPEDESGGSTPLLDDNLTGLVFDDEVCPFPPGE